MSLEFRDSFQPWAEGGAFGGRYLMEETSESLGAAWWAAMLAGRFAEAWAINDGLRAAGVADPHRMWQGEAFEGKQVMVRCLHGLGDTVQMLRFVPRLRALARGVTVEVAPRLVELAGWIEGMDRVITWGEGAPVEPPVWEVQMEVMELPYVLRVGVEELPGAEGYLRVPEAVKAAAGRAMGERRRPRVGLVWSGGEWNMERWMPLEVLEGALAGVGVEWWNLQGVREGEERPVWPPRDVLEVGDGLAALAGCVAGLDLMVTTDTMAAHLAGAMGVPVWVMLPFAADWRWMEGRLDSPWYPGMRLFRQPVAGDWGSVAGAVRGALEGWLIA